jgi:hypothetical protein
LPDAALVHAAPPAMPTTDPAFPDEPMAHVAVPDKAFASTRVPDATLAPPDAALSAVAAF